MRWLVAGGLLLVSACAMLIVGARLDNSAVSAGGAVLVLPLLVLRWVHSWWGTPGVVAVEAALIVCVAAAGALSVLGN